MYTLDLTTIQEWAAAIIAIGAAIGVLWVPTKWAFGKIRGRYRKCVKFFKDIDATTTQVSVIYPMIIKVNEEMKPNGGSSLRDAIDRIALRTAAAELRLRLVTESIDQISFETDSNGDCQWVSRQWSRVYGISTTDALGKGWVNGVCFPDREKVVEEWENAVADKRKYEMIYRANPENPTWISCEAHPLFVGNRVQGWVGYIHKVDAPKDGQVG